MKKQHQNKPRQHFLNTLLLYPSFVKLDKKSLKNILSYILNHSHCKRSERMN
jgi:hypothetical protein